MSEDLTMRFRFPAPEEMRPEGEQAREVRNVEVALMDAVIRERAFVEQIPLSRDQRILIAQQACDEIKSRLTSADTTSLYDLVLLFVTMLAQSMVAGLAESPGAKKEDAPPGSTVTEANPVIGGIAPRS